MKRYYYLVAAAGLAATILFVRYVRHESRPQPSLPVPSEPVRTEPGVLPPLPTIPALPLPEVPAPPDSPSTMLPSVPLPPIPGSSESPAIPFGQNPAMPLEIPSALQPAANVQIPTVPMGDDAAPPLPIPTLPIASEPNGQAGVPAIPAPPMSLPQEFPGMPILPLAPKADSVPTPPLVAPVPPQPSSAAPNLLATPTGGSQSPVVFSPHGKFLVLRAKVADGAPELKPTEALMKCKLLKIDGISTSSGKDQAIVQQGAIVRNIPKAEILFVGETREEVYRFMRDRVPQNETPGRMAVARWCMFNGMREQALIEAHAILQLDPQSKVAMELARSLEESLKQFPSEDAPASAAQKPTRPATAVEAEVEIAPEAATTFGTRVQPILANLCVDCHARPDYAGSFKLVRAVGLEAGPQVTQTNLRATAKQLSKSDPSNSPLLTKAIAVHGGLKQPIFVSRQIAGFRVLEGWVYMALGSAPPAAAAQNFSPFAQPTPVESTNAAGAKPDQNSTTGLPGLPTVPTTPAATNPLLPPAGNVPSTPQLPPAVPPAVSVPAVLPTPTVMPPTVPSLPPEIPPADGTPKIPVPPAIPQSPPAASLPAVPGAVRPSGGSQFGAGIEQKVKSGPANGDEFDPSAFNRTVPAGRDK